MSYSKLCFSFFFLSFAYSFSTSLNTTTRKCSAQQSHALLQFKQNLTSINFSIDYPGHSPCQDWLGFGYGPILMNWNTSTDCCNWNRVTCDNSTGDVIGLDLTCGMLRGTIHPNTSLFNLPHLQRLSLGFNDFSGSQLPREIGRFSNSLTHLYIAYSGFAGGIPSEITLLRKMVYLDLSYSWYDLKLESHVFVNMLRNYSTLEELSLNGVNISSVLPTYLNISSSFLTLLDLGRTGLKGNLPRDIFGLQSLEKLNFSSNSFTGQIPLEISRSPNLVSLDFSRNKCGLQIQTYVLNDLLTNFTRMEVLWMSCVDISGVLPTYLNITSLRSLDLRSTRLKGKLPYNIFNLQNLEHLYLSGNQNLSGPLPEANTSSNIPLKILELTDMNISEEIPNTIGYLRSLNILDLSGCGLVGSLPKSLVKLRYLSYLDLSHNMLNGTLPSSLFTLSSLESIILGDNMFSGNLPFDVFSLQSLKQLKLSNNQLSGQIDVLDQGPILQTFRNLTNLSVLDLSYNNFRGDWELDTLLSSLINLLFLDLSYSGLSIMTYEANHHVNSNLLSLSLGYCELKVFPESLRSMKNLLALVLPNNSIHGNIPDWVGQIGGNRLQVLDLSYNSITQFPQFESWNGLGGLFVQSNMIEGPFPPSICNMSNLFNLDMSNNSFVGMIPPCFGNIISSAAQVDLGTNRFHGTIPNIFGECEFLQYLILNENQLQGEVPNSLSKCKHLYVLDMGNNQFNGTFPNWLGDLSILTVLVLKSNNFHGPIETSSTVELPFPSLQVLDLSHNFFTGKLPQKYFQNFNSMKNVVTKHTKVKYLSLGFKYYSTTFVLKGVDQYFSRILVDYIIVDLSSNRFEGEIPNVMGNLTSLILLNLSHNSLTGRIPVALGQLSEIESLDLSCNQLTGEIPQSLADLTFLGYLNLSQNDLMGRIPQGKQFDTFEGNSFEGNPKLCGLQLPKKCTGPPHQPEVEGNGDDDDETGFTWRVVMLGYGCGTILGLVMGFLMFSTGRPKWFYEMYDAVEHMILRRRNKRRYIFIGK